MTRRAWLALVSALVLASPVVAAPPRAGDDGGFAVSAPVACREIRGFEDYEPLPGATLTADEKLLVYFRPRHFKSARKGNKYEVHFTQEGSVKRRGESARVLLKLKTMEFRSSYPTAPEQIYLTNTIALKGLKPGDYDFEIVLRDAIAGSSPAITSLHFKVVAAAIPEPDANPDPAPAGSKREGPAVP